MRAAYGKYQADGLVILSVSEEEGVQAVENFIQNHNLSYPFVLDSDGEIGRNYNLYTTPTTFFITPEGVIQAVIPGLVTESWVDMQMSRLNG